MRSKKLNQMWSETSRKYKNCRWAHKILLASIWVL